MTARESEIIELIRKEVKPALGCTEPIAVALAVAKAMEIMDEKCGTTDSGWRMKDGYSLRIEVSGNILHSGQENPHFSSIISIAFATARATAIGSVQPSAGLTSFLINSMISDSRAVIC